MCGVLGIMGTCSVMSSRELLLLLTHRGQDASGLLWIDDTGFATAKSMGSPASLEVPQVSTEMILGSTRYPTSGKRISSEADLTTFVGPFNSKELAITHNGNITNMTSLSDDEYECDTEFLVVRLNHHLEKHHGSLPEAFRSFSEEVDGAYSLVGIYKDRLFAFRDPRGFKPLVFGRSDGLTIVASESLVLDMMGVGIERDVYPGELLVIGPGSFLESYSIHQNKTHSHCFFEYVYFAHPAAMMENQLAYDVRFRLGRALARRLNALNLDPPDYVVPVPDTSRPAAQALAEELKVPIREIILKHRYLGRTFIANTQEERNSMAKYKYIYLGDKLKGKNILVVDDSIVRGTTAKMIVSDLRKRGAARVYFVATCPPQTHPCYYGIDISTDKELIASSSTEEEIARFIEADVLIYQDISSLINAIGLKDLCLACLNGMYPTEHARRIRELVRDSDSSVGERDYERVV